MHVRKVTLAYRRFIIWADADGTRAAAPVAQTSSRHAWRSVSVRIDNSQPANRSLKGRPRVGQRVAAVGGVN